MWSKATVFTPLHLTDILTSQNSQRLSFHCVFSIKLNNLSGQSPFFTPSTYSHMFECPALYPSVLCAVSQVWTWELLHHKEVCSLTSLAVCLDFLWCSNLPSPDGQRGPHCLLDVWRSHIYNSARSVNYLSFCHVRMWASKYKLIFFPHGNLVFLHLIFSQKKVFDAI